MSDTLPLSTSACHELERYRPGVLAALRRHNVTQCISTADPQFHVRHLSPRVRYLFPELSYEQLDATERQLFDRQVDNDRACVVLYREEVPPSLPADKVLECLNTAFQADSAAMHALIVNRVPCNQALGDHPHVAVESGYTVDGCFVGALGLVNGVLTAAGLPLVAVQFSDELDREGRRRILGFQMYTPPAQDAKCTTEQESS